MLGVAKCSLCPKFINPLLLNAKHNSHEIFKHLNISIPYERCDDAVNDEKKQEVYSL
jgi:hypothetical protein